MKCHNFVNPKEVSLYVNFHGEYFLQKISICVTWDTNGNSSPRSKILKIYYTMHLGTVYPNIFMKCQKFCEPRIDNFILELPQGKAFVYYPHFGCSRDYWKGLTKERNSERAYSMPFDIGYPNHVPIIWNSNSFVTLEVECWYVNFSVAELLHMISILVTRETVGNVF